MQEEIINIFSLDLFDPDDFLVPVTFSIADFKDLSSRNGSFTKTITLPASKKNDSIFSYNFHVTAQGLFDRNKRVRGSMERDNIRIFLGSIQLKKVNIANGRIVSYEVVLFSNNADWIEALSDNTLRSLPFDLWEGSSQDIVDTWSTTGDTSQVLFPLSDYGDSALNTEDTEITVYPAVYVKQIIKMVIVSIGCAIPVEVIRK